jgi:signal transduction histidine kinase
LTNILKHAHAAEVTVKVRVDRGKFSLEVCDDGSGFDPRKVCEGNGLRNMQDRARLLEAASLVVDTGQGRGTTVRLDVRIT